MELQGNLLQEEKFEFSRNIKKWLGYIAAAGLVLAVLGIVIISLGHHGGAEAEGAHHGPVWLQRVWTAIWVNNVYFTGIALIGVFFVALNYAAQAGWSVVIKRVPEAFGSWLPYAGVIALVVFLAAKGTLFHWTVENSDPIILGKKPYLNVGFFVVRMILYYGIWYLMYLRIRKRSLEEDTLGGVANWRRIRVYSVIFIVIFAITSSTSSWDWVMSTDPHWFSTLFGWYVFSSWFVAGLVSITLVLIGLKESGYLSAMGANHLHDMGKYIFAFSIFWMYLWFSQYMLIYYSNIPEEALHYYERLHSPVYGPMFYVNIILNFFFPFIVLMTRDSKRHGIFLKIAGVVLLIGHWIDFYLQIAPPIVGQDGGIGFLELGLTLIFGSAFLFVIFGSMARAPLVARKHPMLEESMHYHT